MISVMKRTIVIVLILGVVAAIAVLGYQFLGQPIQQGSKAQALDGEVVVVRSGTIVDTINATGRVLPEGQALVGFESQGRVKEVLVVQGQRVKRGDVLARLETDDLEMALAEAQAALQQSEASLAQARMKATPEEIAAAQANVESAQATYDKKMAGPDPDDVTSKKAALKKAELALRKAQEDYDAVAYRADVGLTPQAEALQQASIDYEKAKADFNLATNSPTEEEKKAAAATLADAKSKLASLLRKPVAEDVAVSEAGVTKARTAVEKARANLQNAVLKSPIDGVVVEVNVRVGEVPKETTAIILVDDSRLHIDVAVDEIDIRRVKAQQPVSVTLEALPDEVLPGKVVSISPATTDSETLLQSPATASAGVPSYIVTIELAHNSPDLRVGMSAKATVQTRLREGVPLVPNRAIQIERETGKEYVDKLDGEGTPVRTEIKTGLRNETDSEVLSGLAAGDKVLITTISGRKRLENAMQGND
jgi:HlyD family secretion protein